MMSCHHSNQLKFDGSCTLSENITAMDELNDKSAICDNIDGNVATNDVSDDVGEDSRDIIVKLSPGLQHFDILKLIGKGAFGSVYVVKVSKHLDVMT